MANTGGSFKMEAIREVAAASVGAAYAQIGGNITHSAKIIFIKNSTDKDIYISLDGVNTNKRVLTGSVETIDLKTNDIRTQELSNYLQLFQKQTPVDAAVPNGGVPTKGLLTVEVVYT